MTHELTSTGWDDGVDELITGDLTGALGYRTPAGGVVVQAVAPIGLRDRERGRIGFTTSLGFSKKLDRIDVARAATRLRGTAHTLLGFAGADGRPVVLPVSVAAHDAAGLVLSAAWSPPPGGRRAGLLGHSYRPRLVGLRTRQHTGWLSVGDDGEIRYAPHTETGYVAPPNKTLLLLLNGALAKRGTRAAGRRLPMEAR